MPLDTIQINVRDDAELIFNADMIQTPGVGTGGNTYQTTQQFQFPTSLLRGKFIGRTKSNYIANTHTKTGIEAEDGIGGWPATLHEDVLQLQGSGIVAIDSAANLVPGVNYTGLWWWIDDNLNGTDWYDLVFIQQTQTIQQAIDAGAVWPTGDAIVATNTVTIVGTTSPATVISFAGSVITGAAAGAFIGQATSDRSNGTWSMGTPSFSWFAIDANTGQATIAPGEFAPAASATPYMVQLVYDNTAAGGGQFTTIVNVTVNAASAGTDRTIPVPASNSTNLSAAQMIAALDSLNGGNWAAGMASLGLTIDDSPMLEFGAGVTTSINYSSYDFDQPVYIRGSGTYTRDEWTPLLNGTNITRIQLNNCNNLQFWMMEVDHSSDNTCFNSTNCEFVRCAFNGDVARSESAIALIVASFAYAMNFSNSDSCAMRQCVFNGYRNSVMDTKTENSTNIEIIGCLASQLSGDFISLRERTGNDGWTIENLFWPGIVRHPNTGHMDLTQQQLGAEFKNARINSCWVAVAQIKGGKFNPSLKITQTNSAASGNQDHDIFDCFNVGRWFTVDGAGGKHSGGSLTWTAVVIAPDINRPTDCTEQVVKGNATEPFVGQARCDARGGIGTYANNCRMAIPAASSNMINASGVELIDNGFTDLQDPAYNASLWAQWFPNLVASSTLTTIRPSRRAGDIGGWFPATTAPFHWDTATAGPWRLMQQIFHPTLHDHPKDWGWPAAPGAHLSYDLFNAMAGASGLYSAFAADGSYTG